MEPVLELLIVWVIRVIEIAGILVLVGGAIYSSFRFALSPRSLDSYHAFRSNLGRAILLGLEFLIVADIINTVAIEPTLDSVVVLGGIVLIRTFLSFALQAEIEGRWPWQRAGHAADPNEATRGS